MAIRRSAWVEVVLVGAVVLGVAINAIAGHVEGVIAPAASPATIIEGPYKAEEGWSAARFATTKLRNCSYVEIEWFQGKRDGLNVPLIVRTGPPVVREAGAFDFEVQVNTVPPEVMAENTFSDVIHDCWSFTVLGVKITPWLTRTRFYDPPAAL